MNKEELFKRKQQIHKRLPELRIEIDDAKEDYSKCIEEHIKSKRWYKFLKNKRLELIKELDSIKEQLRDD